jgi:hypothetical protein
MGIIGVLMLVVAISGVQVHLRIIAPLQMGK